MLMIFALEYKDRTIVLVEDSLKCIQDLARYKRSLYDIPVVGLPVV